MDRWWMNREIDRWMNHGYQNIDSHGKKKWFGYLINIRSVGWRLGGERGGPFFNYEYW